MSKFLSKLTTDDNLDGTFTVKAPLVYESDLHKDGLFCVDAGIVTDGASVPRPLWTLWPPMGGKYDAAAVLHDDNYRRNPKHLTREQADAIFKEAMAACKVGWFSRQAIYRGVRIGGGGIWDRYRAADAQQKAAV